MIELNSQRRYKILYISEDSRWIHLRCNEYDIDEPDSFIELVKRVQKILDGKIIDLGNTRYCFEEEKMNLIFQWDTLFGIVVEYPENISLKEAVQFLKTFCD